MRRSNLAVTAASVLALLTAFPAAAQSAGEIRIGGEASGTLAAGDGEVTEGDLLYRFDDYRFTATRGQRLEAILRAESFDAYLAVYAEGGLDAEPIATDDDGLGEGTNARLRFAAPQDGAYILRARSFHGLESGDYSLSLKERGPAIAAPAPGPITLGAPVDGTLAAGDPEQDDGVPYDAYAFDASAGDRIAIRLASEAFDPVVVVGRTDAGGDFTELARNDDAPTGGLNSYLVFTAPATGAYVVRATPLSADPLGGYQLSLEAGPPPVETRPVAVGDTVEGALAADDGVNDAGVRFDGYRFTGRADQRIVVEMSSDDFDTYLALVGPDGATLAEDDDGAGEGTNSRLTHTLAAAGDYVIEARAFGDEATGAYTLKVTETAPPPPPQPLAFGATVQGEITDADPKDDEGRGYDAFVFSGEAGRRVQIIMRSGDFDTFLQIGAAGDDFTAQASDDDGLREGTDSRLIHTLEETGDYVVRASPLGGEADGLYSIELVDRGPQPRAGSILIGATARGELTENDGITEEGGYFDAYRFRAKAGEELRITMASNDFDAVVSVGEDSEDGAFEALASDDDGLSDTHAKLEWTADEDGWYVIRANSFDPRQLGPYVLTVERQP